MREKEIKTPEENDPIKKMLERLRRSVTDLPPDKSEGGTGAGHPTPADMVVSDAVQALKEKIGEENEDDLLAVEILDAEESADTDDSFMDNIEQIGKDVAEGGDADAVDDDVIAQFFAPATKTEEKSASKEMPVPDVPMSVPEETKAEIPTMLASDEEEALYALSSATEEEALSDLVALDGEAEGDPLIALEEMLSSKKKAAPLTNTPTREKQKEGGAVVREKVTSVDDFAAAFPPVKDTDEPTDTPNMSYLTTKTLAVSREETISKNFQKSIEGVASQVDEGERSYAVGAIPTPFDPIDKEAFSAPVEEEPEAAFIMHTEISDQEAELLFASKHRNAEEDARRYVHRSLVKENLDFETEAVDATEENGYAVEVEVRSSRPAEPIAEEPIREEIKALLEETMPVAEEKPASSATEEPILLIDTDPDGQDEDALCDDFLELLAEGQINLANGKREQKDAASPAKPNAYARRKSIRKAEQVLGDSVTGEQMSMDLFSEESAEHVSQSMETPDVPVVTPLSPSFVEEPLLEDGYDVPPAESEAVTESAPSAPLFAAPAAARMAEPVSAEDEEVSVGESVDAEQLKAQREALRAEKRRERKKKIEAARKEFYQEELSAVAGLYEEHAASYNEFTSQGQVGAIGRRFLSELSATTVRVFSLAFLSVLFFLTENLSLFGLSVGAFFADGRILLALHFVAVVLTALCSISAFTTAWRGLFCHRVTSELYIALLLIATLLYDVFLLLIPTGELHLFGFLMSAPALVLAASDHRKISADFAAFRVLSSAGDKLACKITKGGATPAERAAVVDLPEGLSTRVMGVKKIGFAKGFFHRITRTCEDGRVNLILLIAAVTVALAAALITGLTAGSFLMAFFAFLVALSLSLPALLLVLHKTPLACLSRRATGLRSAVVGEVSAIEYSDIGAIAFEDVEAFSSRNVVVQRIKTYAGSTIVDVIYRVASLFSLVGGPLDGVFHSSTADIGMSENAMLLSAEDGGILASVDGREISVGCGDYMLAHRIHVYFDPEDEKILAGGKVNVLYAAEEGKLIAKFYIRYKMNEDFEKHAEQLHKYGVRTLIRTYDPLLSDALIEKISYTADFGVRVIKKTVEQQHDFAEAELNSGVVSRSSTRDVLKTLYACRRTVRFSRVFKVVSLAVSGVGMVGAILLSAFGWLGGLPTAVFALYQLLLLGAFALSAKLYI